MGLKNLNHIKVYNWNLVDDYDGAAVKYALFTFFVLSKSQPQAKQQQQEHQQRQPQITNNRASIFMWKRNIFFMSA